MLLQSREHKTRETKDLTPQVPKANRGGPRERKKKRNLVASVQEEQEAISQKEIVSGTIFSLRKAGVLKSCA